MAAIVSGFFYGQKKGNTVNFPIATHKLPV